MANIKDSFLSKFQSLSRKSFTKFPKDKRNLLPGKRYYDFLNQEVNVSFSDEVFLLDKQKTFIFVKVGDVPQKCLVYSLNNNPCVILKEDNVETVILLY